MNKKILLLLVLFGTFTIITTSAFAHQSSPLTFSITGITNHSMVLNWSSDTLKDKNHHAEILACGGINCNPKATLISFSQANSLFFDGTGHEGLQSGSTWGFIVKECHRTGVLSNQPLCVSSGVVYGKTL